MLAVSACGTAAPAKSSPSASRSPSPTPTPLSSVTSRQLPVGRSAAGIAYDQARHNLVLFGGIGGQTILDDTWTWDGSAWSQRQGLTTHPPARQGPALAYDEAGKQVILFGGAASAGALGDTWAWDGTAWQQLQPAHAPSPREGASMVYDPSLASIILYGGVSGSNALNETWSWKGGDWTQVQAPGPTGGTRARLAFLAGSNLVVRYGDCGSSHDSGLYTFDGHAWVQKTVSGSQPPSLCTPSMAGDASHHSVILFGGTAPSAGSPAAGTWSFDGNAWTESSPAQSPPARADASMVYDVDHHLIVLFGGQGLSQGQTGPLNDTWSWDGSSWTAHQ